jgi:hypothetical protein
MGVKLLRHAALLSCAIGLVVGANSAALADTVDLFCRNDATSFEFHLLIDFDQSTVTMPGVYAGIQAQITATEVLWQYDTSSDSSDPQDCTLSRDTGKLRIHYRILTSSGKFQGYSNRFATCAKAAKAF